MNLKEIKPGAVVMVATGGWTRGYIEGGRGGVLGIVLGIGQYRTQVQGACGEEIVVPSEFHAKNGIAVALLDNSDPAKLRGVQNEEHWTPTPKSQWRLRIVRSKQIFSMGMFLEARMDLDNMADEMNRVNARQVAVRDALIPLLAKAVAAALKNGSLTVDTRNSYGPEMPHSAYLVLTSGSKPDPQDYLKGAEREQFIALHKELADLEARYQTCYRRAYR